MRRLSDQATYNKKYNIFISLLLILLFYNRFFLIEIIDDLFISQEDNLFINEEQDNLLAENKEETQIVIEEAKIPRRIVVIDAGHQIKGNMDKEPSAPNSDIWKAKVAYGTKGVVTKIPEYQFNLDMSFLLKEQLERKDYQVVLIRDKNEVDISNQERAKMANKVKDDNPDDLVIYIRIHGNGSNHPGAHGIETYHATSDNPYVGKWSSASQMLSEEILKALIEETGAKDRGVRTNDDWTGTNFANLPTSLIELGYMTNPEEDRKLSDPEYRKKLAIGMMRGIENYFERAK